MTMPETAMNEYYRLTPRQDHVRRARQTFVVKPVSESSRVQRTPELELWFGVPGSNAGHVQPTLLRTMRIGLTGSTRCHALIGP